MLRILTIFEGIKGILKGADGNSGIGIRELGNVGVCKGITMVW